jgi:prepilin-type N-terminal cleavage/methylation domain-containing protein
MPAASPSRPPSRWLRADRRGFTFVELMIVLTIAAVVSALAIISVSGVNNNRVRAEALRLSGAMRMVYGRAAINGLRYQFVFDIESNSYRVQCSTENVLLDAPSDQSRSARRRASRYASDDPEADPFGLGSSAPTLDDCSEDLLEAYTLRKGVRIRGVLTTHDSEPVEEGENGIAFFPNGFVERSMVWLESEDERTVVTLTVDPMTGRIRIWGEDREIPRDFFSVEEDR